MQSGYGMASPSPLTWSAALVGGAAIGWLVDSWLDSAPLVLIAFFFLGAAAGMWNVYRTVRGYDVTLGFGQPPAASAAGRNEDAGRRAAGE